MTDGVRAGLTGDRLAAACAAAMLGRDRASQGLCIRIDQSRAGSCRLSMTVNETMINGHGIAHGGTLFTLADTAFALACNSRNVPHVALDATISFIAAARLGDELVAHADERSLGGRTGFYDVTVTRASGDLVAIFRGTCYRVRGTVLADGAA